MLKIRIVEHKVNIFFFLNLFNHVYGNQITYREIGNEMSSLYVMLDAFFSMLEHREFILACLVRAVAMFRCRV
jgi:hypothetical protein